MTEKVAAMGMRNPKVVGTECDKVASEKVATEPIPEGEETNHVAILREEQGSRLRGEGGRECASMASKPGGQQTKRGDTCREKPQVSHGHCEGAILPSTLGA